MSAAITARPMEPPCTEERRFYTKSRRLKERPSNTWAWRSHSPGKLLALTFGSVQAEVKAAALELNAISLRDIGALSTSIRGSVHAKTNKTASFG
jgi:hypothetical protein